MDENYWTEVPGRYRAECMGYIDQVTGDIKIGQHCYMSDRPPLAEGSTGLCLGCERLLKDGMSRITKEENDAMVREEVKRILREREEEPVPGSIEFLRRKALKGLAEKDSPKPPEESE